MTALSAAAGLAAGAVWSAVAPRSVFVVGETGVVPDIATSGAAFAAEGWFTVVVAVAGLLLAAAVWTRTSDDGIPALVGLTLGGLLGAVVAARLGHALGPDPLPPSLADLPVGTRVSEPIDVRAKAAFLVWPLVAVASYFSLVVSSSGKDKRSGQDRRSGKDARSAGDDQDGSARVTTDG